MIAGYRWDTSGNEDGRPARAGTTELRDSVGFVARHPLGLLERARHEPYSTPANRPG